MSGTHRRGQKMARARSAGASRAPWRGRLDSRRFADAAAVPPEEGRVDRRKTQNEKIKFAKIGISEIDEKSFETLI
jgi:hypothetical protein